MKNWIELGIASGFDFIRFDIMHYASERRDI